MPKVIGALLHLTNQYYFYVYFLITLFYHTHGHTHALTDTHARVYIHECMHLRVCACLLFVYICQSFH